MTSATAQERASVRPRPLDAVVASAGLQVRLVLVRPMNVVTGVITPVMLLAILVLGRPSPPDPATSTAVVTGVLLAALWNASLWSSSGILRRERADGTFARSLTGVQPPVLVLLGKIGGGTLLDIALVIAATAAAVPVLGLHPVVEHPAALAVGLLAVMLGGVGGSLLLGTLLVVSRYGRQLTIACGVPVMLLGGTILPVDQLPEAVRWVSALVNLSWLQAFLASTASSSPDVTALLVGTALSVAYGVTGALLFRVVLRRARREGSLELR